MASNTFAVLNGHFTESYADAVGILPAETAKLVKKIAFVDKEKQTGNLYHQPVALSRENGVVFNSDGSAFSTTDPGALPASYEDAQIRGTEILIPTQLSYGAAARALGGKKQFVNETKFLVQQNARAMAHHLELGLLYGQTSIAATSEITASGTTGTFVVTAATWAPGIWRGSVGMVLDFFVTIGAAAPINTNAAITVTSVNYTTRTVSFTCASGDAANLNSETTGFIFRRRANAGSSSFRESAGIDKIVTNTGTLFNISASTYDLWAGNSYDCSGGPLTMFKIQAGLAAAVHAGLDEDVTIICNPVTWANVMSDLTALRMFDNSYSSEKAESGSKGITFYGQNGKIEFMPHILCKQGEAFAVPLKLFSRIGSTDVTYKMPGMPSEQLLFQLPNNAGYEFRSYTDQALFCEAPAKLVKFVNILNV